MDTYDTRTARVAVLQRRGDLQTLIDSIASRFGAHLETAALYFLVSAFWALVVYEALSALQ